MAGRGSGAAAKRELKTAFIQRSVAAINRIADAADERSLGEAMAAASDVGALARVLSDSGLLGGAVLELDPLAPLLARGAVAKADMMRSAGGALSAPEVAAHLGITRQAVDKRRRAGRLLAVMQAGDHRYPACQFTTEGILPGLPELLACIEEVGPWDILQFLVTPQDQLNGSTPVEQLNREGRVSDRLRELACGLGRHGAA